MKKLLFVMTFAIISNWLAGCATTQGPGTFEQQIARNLELRFMMFWNLEEGFGQNLANRIRYDLGVGTNISKAWRIEVHGISQDGGEIDLDPFSSDEKILRVRLFYSFN